MQEEWNVGNNTGQGKTRLLLAGYVDAGDRHCCKACVHISKREAKNGNAFRSVCTLHNGFISAYAWCPSFKRNPAYISRSERLLGDD
jgi:hypothetical protein